ncbi:MAG: hypothetical protein KBA61_15895 [Spirochaetes bacterium]|nr:hypothetical protein [Spirochaetota bacterium]
MKSRFLLAAVVPILLFISVSSGEVIRLKNGNVIQGAITQEAPNTIKLIDAATKKEITLKRADIATTVSEKAIDGPVNLVQLKALNNDGWRKLEEKSKIATVPKPEPTTGKPFVEKFQPRAGLFVSYMMPSGDIGPALDPAIGFGLLFDMRMPVFAETSTWDLRTGITLSYATFGSTGDALPADVTLIPILINNEIGYKTIFGLRPYFTLDLGITMASLKDKSDNTEKKNTSSMDLTVFAGVGAGYRHPKLPMLELFLDAGYMMVFEQTNGNFININFGAAYHFSSKTGEQL